MAEELVELGRRGCPKGKILRRSYTTKRGVKVGPSCVPDRGAPGKTPAAKRILPKPEPGALRGWSKNKSASARRRIVASISRDDGCATAIRRLTVLRNLTTDRATERAAKADADWLRRQGFCRLKKKAR
jgi:hypothetical protein